MKRILTYRPVFITCVSMVLFLCLVQIAQAQSFVPLAEVKGTKLATLYSGPEGDLSIFFTRIFTVTLTIGAILAIFRIAWGGYLYMTTDLWSSKERARETLRETVLGLLLLIGVWVILNQINPDILKLNILETIRNNPAPPASAVSSGVVGSARGTSPVLGEVCAVLTGSTNICLPNTGQGCEFVCGFSSLSECAAGGFALASCRQY